MAAARIAELEKRLAQNEARIAELERESLIPEPPYQPLSCGYCKQYGHHVDHCYKAFTRRIKGAKNDCYRGRHDPYQHGADWRCNCCGKHMSDAEARQYPVYPRRVKKQFVDASTQTDSPNSHARSWLLPPSAYFNEKKEDWGSWTGDSD